MIVDSHCHLDYPEFESDLNALLSACEASGVGKMLSACISMKRFEANRAIAATSDKIVCSVGIHPHEAEKEKDVSIDDILSKTEDEKIVAIGECGLDYFYDNSPQDTQKDIFAMQLKAAHKADLPVIVHTRDAEDDTIDLISRQMEQGAVTGVIHCFSGGPDLAKAALDLGFYISASGIATFPKSTTIQEALKNVPLDRLLIETDSPYLAPVPMRGKRNTPAHLKYTAAFLADLKGVSYQELSAQTTENFFSLFPKARAS